MFWGLLALVALVLALVHQALLVVVVRELLVKVMLVVVTIQVPHTHPVAVEAQVL